MMQIQENPKKKDQDKKRIWRDYVNEELKGSYKKIFDMIDSIIFLKVPSFKYVFKWRLLQERKLKISSKGKKIMNDAQIKKFIMFYERLTKHMLKHFHKKANILININNDHRLKSIKIN